MIYNNKLKVVYNYSEHKFVKKGFYFIFIFLFSTQRGVGVLVVKRGNFFLSSNGLMKSTNLKEVKIIIKIIIKYQTPKYTSFGTFTT
jgi:hypothetical protein